MRKHLALLVAFACLGSTALTGHAQGDATGDDWPMRGRDPQHTNFNQEMTIEPEPNIRWRRALGLGGIWSSPVTADGVVYTGSYDGHLYALSAATGRRIWRSRVGTVNATPAVADGVIYTGGDTSLYALDAATGELLWRYEPLGEKVVSSLLVVDGILFSAAHSWEAGEICALDAATGEVKWTRDVSNNDLRCITSDGRAIYVLAESSTRVTVENTVLYALNAQDGQSIWEFRPQATWALHSCPAVLGETVYVGSDRTLHRGDEEPAYLYALDSVSGDVNWRFHHGEESVVTESVLSAAASTDVVYVAIQKRSSPGSGDLRLWSIVLAVDAISGEPLWSYRVPSEYGQIDAPPTVGGELVYVGTDYGWVIAIDASNGKQLWELDVGRGCDVHGSPVVVNGVVYTVSTNTVYAIGNQVGNGEIPCWLPMVVALVIVLVVVWTVQRRSRCSLQ